MRYLLSTLLLLAFCFSCQRNINPPAPGFNLNQSDPEAIKIADDVMTKMGGRANWDKTRFIHWNFFGRRTLLWDKWEGKVRIENTDGSMIYLVDINNNTGKIQQAGVEMVQADSISKYATQGKNIWINDAYWLVMPFKLKDSGLTLKHKGEGKTQDGQMADILELTFESVGVTPQNKYLVYVDKNSGLVSQWDYYTNASDAEPRLSTPWKGYTQHGDILLSGDRGQMQLSEIKVLDYVPAEAFNSFEPVKLD
jgi:hypothetical protein